MKAGYLASLSGQMQDKDQAYFWTQVWQESELEAEQDLRQGRTKQFKTLEALIDDLDAEEIEPHFFYSTGNR
jgi:hypothetical protein